MFGFHLIFAIWYKGEWNMGQNVKYCIIISVKTEQICPILFIISVRTGQTFPIHVHVLVKTGQKRPILYDHIDKNGKKCTLGQYIAIASVF